MKIDPSAPIRSASVRRTRANGRARASDAFTDHLSEENPSAAGVTTLGPLAVNPLLAVQEVADATSESARERARGEAMLDRLDEVRIGLLAGYISKRDLSDLSRLARVRRVQIKDEKLAQVLEEIELRAEVELAKLSIEA